MGTYAQLAALKKAGKLEPYEGKMPRTGVKAGDSGYSWEPLHRQLATWEKWHGKVRGCVSCKHSMKRHDRLGCKEDGCGCRQMRVRKRKA